MKPNCTVKGCITASTILKKLYYYSMRSMPNIIFILKKSSQAISFRLQQLVLFKMLLVPPWGFPGGSDGRESTCNAGDLGLLPGWGRSPGEGKGNPLQQSCLEKSMDRGAWWAAVHGVTKSWTQLKDQH